MLHLILVAVLSRAALGGCAVDVERDARRAMAPVVVSGEVLALEVVQVNPHRLVVYERLRVERAWRGAIETGELLLRTSRPTESCPYTRVHVPGTKVYAIGRPDIDMSIDVSACTDDVGTAVDEGVLEALGAMGGGEVYPGAPPAPPAAHPILPDVADLDGRRLRIRQGRRQWEGALLEDEGDTVVALLHVGGLAVAERVSREDLVPVVASPVALAPGSRLSWSPGAPVGPERSVKLNGPVHADGVVPEGAVDVTWLVGPTIDAGPTDRVTLTEAAVVDEPGGEVRIRLDKGVSLRSLGPAEGGWVPVALSSAHVSGSGWIRERNVSDGTGGVVHGVVGGVVGGVLGKTPVRLALPTGTEVRAPGTGALLARALKPTDVDWLATAGEQAWVVVAAPSGPRVGVVSCTVDTAWPTGCRAR